MLNGGNARNGHLGFVLGSNIDMIVSMAELEVLSIGDVFEVLRDVDPAAVDEIGRAHV